jgi:hypothetical protein
MLEERIIPFEKLITKIYPLNETPVVFKQWNARQALLLKYCEGPQ